MLGSFGFRRAVSQLGLITGRRSHRDERQVIGLRLKKTTLNQGANETAFASEQNPVRGQHQLIVNLRR